MDDDLIGAVRLEPRERFDLSLIGKATTESGESVLVYDYDMIVMLVAKECADGEELTTDHWSDAVEYVEFNTIRGIEYMGERRPLIVYREFDLGEEA